ncbi:MAG: CBS domain-containing protein [Thermodesulfobacteriota bacterium]
MEMNVSQLMTRDTAACSPGDHLHDAARIMWERDCGVVPVVDERERVVGIVTDRDLCMAAYTQGRPLRDIEIASVMSRAVHTCRADDALATALAAMRDGKVRRLPVLDADDRLVGILSLNDVAQAAARERAPANPELAARAILDTLAAVCEPRAPREGAAQMTG